MTEPSRLAVTMDGTPLDPEAARALWTEFSAHMDEHRGDMAGFARKKGWHSVLPEYQKGRAVLVIRTTAAPLSAPPPHPAERRAEPPARAPNRGPRAPNRARQQAEHGAGKKPGKKQASPQKGSPPPPKKQGPPGKGPPPAKKR